MFHDTKNILYVIVSKVVITTLKNRESEKEYRYFFKVLRTLSLVWYYQGASHRLSAR
jgi:hypothetical protein